MINKKKLLLTTVLLLAFLTNNSYANTAFIDFKKVLNTSTAGAEAQKILQKKIESQANKFNKEEKEIRKAETQIISQKKLDLQFKHGILTLLMKIFYRLTLMFLIIH